jgi:hypothetical protein
MCIQVRKRLSTNTKARFQIEPSPFKLVEQWDVIEEEATEEQA